MKNISIILGLLLMGAYIVKRQKSTTPAASGTPQPIGDDGVITAPTVTYEDVVATMQVNPTWVPLPLTNEWNVIFPNGVQNLNLGLDGAWTTDNL